MIPPRDNRPAFAAAMGWVKEGMTRQQVRAILGEPGAIQVQSGHSPRPWSGYLYWAMERPGELWLYGCEPGDPRPYLGVVRFLAGRVREAYGGLSSRPTTPTDAFYLDAIAPLTPGSLPERDVRRMLLRIDETATGNDWVGELNFHPGRAVVAVNALHALGKERALAVVAEYLRLGGLPSIVFPLLRILLAVPYPPGYLSPLASSGSPNDLWRQEPLDDPRSVPRYPIVIAGDMPFLVAPAVWQDDELAGPSSGFTRACWERISREATLRPRPLQPADSLASLLPRLFRSPQWLWGVEKNPLVLRRDPQRGGFWQMVPYPEQRQLPEAQAAVQAQWLQLAHSVYPMDSAVSPASWQGGGFEGYYSRDLGAMVFPEILAEVARLPTRWDATSGRYVRTDGGRRRIHPPTRRTLDLVVGGRKLRVVARRRFLFYAWIEVQGAFSREDPLQITAFPARHGASPLVVGQLTPQNWLSFRLPDDGRFRLEIVYQGKRVASRMLLL